MGRPKKQPKKKLPGRTRYIPTPRVLKRKVMCLDTGETFETLAEAKAKYGAFLNLFLDNNARYKGHYWVTVNENGEYKIPKSHWQPVLCVETNEAFRSLRKASEKMGIPLPKIKQCIMGERLSVSGFHFKAIDANGNIVDNKLGQDTKVNLIICVDTGIMYKSFNAAAKAAGSEGRLLECLKGEALEVDGREWRYAVETDVSRDRTPVECIESGEIFISIACVAKTLGFSREAVKDYFSGKSKTCGGKHWRKLPREEWLSMLIEFDQIEAFEKKRRKLRRALKKQMEENIPDRV